MTVSGDEPTVKRIPNTPSALLRANPVLNEVIRAVPEGGGRATLLTVIVTGKDGTVWFAESVATASSTWLPFVKDVVFRTMLYGLTVTGEPWLTLSALNCTLVIVKPGPADAVADTGTDPETVAPADGVVIATVVVELSTLNVSGAEVVVRFAESVTTATTVCDALLNVVESRTTL